MSPTRSPNAVPEAHRYPTSEGRQVITGRRPQRATRRLTCSSSVNKPQLEEDVSPPLSLALGTLRLALGHEHAPATRTVWVLNLGYRARVITVYCYVTRHLLSESRCSGRTHCPGTTRQGIYLYLFVCSVCELLFFQTVLWETQSMKICCTSGRSNEDRSRNKVCWLPPRLASSIGILSCPCHRVSALCGIKMLFWRLSLILASTLFFICKLISNYSFNLMGVHCLALISNRLASLSWIGSNWMQFICYIVLTSAVPWVSAEFSSEGSGSIFKQLHLFHSNRSQLAML